MKTFKSEFVLLVFMAITKQKEEISAELKEKLKEIDDLIERNRKFALLF